MITEIADFDIKAGEEAAFEAAVTQAKAIFNASKGFRNLALQRSIETPQRYRLLIEWDTLENHTVDFRGGENFVKWRALVGPYFAKPPEVEHHNKVLAF